MPDRIATCSCGRLAARVRGEPVRVSICHCLACQQRTGSVFAAQARFPAEAVTTHGPSRERVRVNDSGSTARFHFCPECGSTVFYQLDVVPGFISVPIGAFADPGFPPPRVSVYEARKHAWVLLADDIEHID